MKKFGVDLSAVFQLSGDMIADNNAVNEAAQKYPDKLIPFAHIDPGMYCEKGEQALNEIERALGKLQLKGVKLHPEFDHFHLFDDFIPKI